MADKRYEVIRSEDLYGVWDREKQTRATPWFRTKEEAQYALHGAVTARRRG